MLGALITEMTAQCSRRAEQIREQLGAIVFLVAIDKEDMPCNEQHKRCLGIIARAFDAQAECDEALELLRRWEDAIQHDTQPDLDGLKPIDTDALNPISVTLEFFNAALLLEGADEQAELYNMADYIGAAAEILCETTA